MRTVTERRALARQYLEPQGEVREIRRRAEERRRRWLDKNAFFVDMWSFDLELRRCTRTGDISHYFEALSHFNRCAERHGMEGVSYE